MSIMIQVIQTKSEEFKREKLEKSWFIPPSKGIFCDSWTPLAFPSGLAFNEIPMVNTFLLTIPMSQELIQHTYTQGPST